LVQLIEVLLDLATAHNASQVLFALSAAHTAL
jgi:hypothetical protein